MKRYEVEWVESVPLNDNGEADIDAAKYACRAFATESEAREFARKVCVGKFWEVAYVRAFVPITWAEYRDSDGDVWLSHGKPYEYIGAVEEVEP